MALKEAIPLEQLAKHAAAQFQQRFGRQASWIVAAPGRVNLIGEHTDYNGGFVLPMAIERYVVIAADAAPEQAMPARFRLASNAVADSVELTLAELTPQPTGHWSDYIRGVVAGCNDRRMKLPSLDLLLESSVPLGGGLSSSAALEVATATLLEAASGETMPAIDKVLLCQQAEHKFAGMPCGVMDQFSTTMGQADQLMLLDCRSLEVEYIPLTDPDVTVLIINSNVKHELTGSEYPTRRAQCQHAASILRVAELRDASMDDLHRQANQLDELHARRARHVISEIDRTRRAARAIAVGDWASAGELMYESHESLQHDYEVSCAELDLLVELMRNIGYDGGVWGSRMTGGGFGGCTVSLVRTDRAAAIAAYITEHYFRSTNIHPTIFSSRPAGGAQVLRNFE